jgi:hypothetical protein
MPRKVPLPPKPLTLVFDVFLHLVLYLDVTFLKQYFALIKT